MSPLHVLTAKSSNTCVFMTATGRSHGGTEAAGGHAAKCSRASRGWQPRSRGGDRAATSDSGRTETLMPACTVTNPPCSLSFAFVLHLTDAAYLASMTLMNCAIRSWSRVWPQWRGSGSSRAPLHGRCSTCAMNTIEPSRRLSIRCTAFRSVQHLAMVIRPC